MDAVQNGVVPIGVKARNFAVRVESQNVAVRNVYVLTLLCNGRDFSGYRPAHLGLGHDWVPFGGDHIDHFHSKIRHGIRKCPPDEVNATANRHNALATVRRISPYCAVCTESEHAVDIVGVVCGEKLFGNRQELCGVCFHLSAFGHRFCCGRSGLVFKPLAERLDLFLRVGREQMFDCHVRRRDENRFRVRESVKTGLTVVVADARVSNSPEGHGLYKQMNVHLIDRAAAKGQAREEMINCFLVTAEEETGEGLPMLFHFINGGIHVFVGKDWENRPEDFVLHDRVVPSDRIQDRGIEVARFAVGRTSGHNLTLINQGYEPVNGFRADDARVVVGPALRVGSVQLDPGLLGFSYKLLSNRFVSIGVPRRGAPLPPPGCCAPDNFLGRIRDVRGRINENWILSAEFEKNGGQVLCSRLHDDLAHLDASGEEDEVKWQLEKFRDFFFASRDGSDGARIEIFRYEIQQELTCGGQPLGEFEYAWISCRKNLDRRVEEQSQWSIERSDYQSDAIGLPIDFGSVSAFPKSLGNDYVYGLHPLSQLSFRESCGPHGSHDLEDFFLASGLEITAHCSL